MEKMTRKMAETFMELNNMCVSQLTFTRGMEKGESKCLEKMKDEGVGRKQLQEEESVSSNNSKGSVEKKEKKTKKIRKEGDHRSPREKQFVLKKECEEQSDIDRAVPATTNESLLKLKGKSNRKMKKVSHKPKAPASSFLLFFKEQQPQIARTYPTFGVTELTKVAAKCWNDLSIEEKEPYVKLGDEERKVYQEKMSRYRIDYPEQIAEKEKDRKNIKLEKKAQLISVTPKEMEMKKVERVEEPLRMVAENEYNKEVELEECSYSSFEGDEGDSMAVNI